MMKVLEYDVRKMSFIVVLWREVEIIPADDGSVSTREDMCAHSYALSCICESVISLAETNKDDVFG